MCIARSRATTRPKACGLCSKETKRNAAQRRIFIQCRQRRRRGRERDFSSSLDRFWFIWLAEKKSPTRHTKNCCRRKRCPASFSSLHLLSLSPSLHSFYHFHLLLLGTFCACEFVWLSPQWAAACEMQPNPQATAIQIALPSAQRKSNCRLPSSLPLPHSFSLSPLLSFSLCPVLLN